MVVKAVRGAAILVHRHDDSQRAVPLLITLRVSLFAISGGLSHLVLLIPLCDLRLRKVENLARAQVLCTLCTQTAYLQKAKLKNTYEYAYK